MRKKAFLTILLTFIVFFGLVSCDSESLGKVGKLMSDFAGTDSQSIKYSKKEIQRQTEAVVVQVGKVENVLSLKIVDNEGAKKELIGLIDSIIDNPASDLDEKVGIERSKLNSFVKENNPLSETQGDLRHEYDANKTEIEESLGKETAETIENIIEVLTSANDMFNDTKEASIKDVAVAASVAMMGNALNELVSIFDEEESDMSDEEILKDVLDKVGEFDDAAKVYMRLTDTVGLAVLDSIDLESLAGESSSDEESAK